MATGALIGLGVAGLAYNVYTGERGRKGTKEAQEKRSKYYRGLYESPEEHPEFSVFKQQIERESKAATQTLKSSLRRRGITGGRQTKVMKDVTTATQQRTADLIKLIKQRAKVEEFNVGPMPGLPGVDLKGLGSALAWAYRKDPKDTPTTKTPGTLAATDHAAYSLRDMYAQQQPYAYGGR